MKVFWWQGGLHFEPSSDAECVALEGFVKLLDGVKVDVPVKPNTAPDHGGVESSSVS